MISVLLVDDHAAVRSSLRSLLETTDDIKVVAMAEDGVDAVAKAFSYWPDVAVVDISMPYMDGIEATSQILAVCPPTRVVMFSMSDQPEYIQRALEVGALGYVLKNAAANDLLSAIRAIHRGNYYFSQAIAETARKYIHQKGADSWAV